MERTFHMLLYRAYHAQRAFLRPYLEEMGLGFGQPKLIAYLEKNGPCRQKQLADYFEIDPAAVSRMLDSLMKGGFVTQRTDENSRRCHLVELTEQGVAASRQWKERCKEAEKIMLEVFTPEEREKFALALSRVYRNFQIGKGESS